MNTFTSFTIPPLSYRQGATLKAITADSRGRTATPGTGVANEAGTFHYETQGGKRRRVRGAASPQDAASNQSRGGGGAEDKIPTLAERQGQQPNKLRAGKKGRDYQVKLPRTLGKWDGQPGNGLWYSDRKEVQDITGGEPIPFKNDFPDFRSYQAKIKGKSGERNSYVSSAMGFTFTGNRDKDFASADKILAKKLGFKTAVEVARYRNENRLTWHHEPNCQKPSMILVPFLLHDNIPHSGGHSRCRTSDGAAKSWGEFSSLNSFLKFDETEARDEHGRWTSGGSSGTAAVALPKKLTDAQILQRLTKLGVTEVTLPKQKFLKQSLIEAIETVHSAGHAIPRSVKVKADKSRAVAYASGSSLQLSTMRFDEDLANRQVSVGFWSQPNPILHEIGHVNHEKIAGSLYDHYSSWSNSWQDEPIAKKVSKYASRNPKEFVAEVFAGHLSGIRYGDDVMNLYKRYKGPELT